MSNVLLGILAVVLFMGLAIGSAVFLGPRFDEAQSLGAASDIIQSVASVSTAVNAYRMATGYAYGPGLESPQVLVDAGFMRRVPENSLVPGRAPQIYGSNGLDYLSTPAADQPVWSPRFVYMSIGDDRLVCSQVMRVLGHISGSSMVSDTAVSPAVAGDQRSAGCFRTASGGAQINANDYVVFSRIGG